MNLSLLGELVIVLIAAVLITVIFHRLKLPAVVGFLMTGVLIGPGGFSLVKDTRTINALAEIGVMMLLFIIGIEFSLERLQKIQKFFWVAGSSQVGLTVAVVTLIVKLSGVHLQESILYGFLVALSSTAVVLKILADKNQLNSPSGQISTGILIFQDMAIVPMLALIPVLANLESVSLISLGSRFLISILAVLAVYLIARKVMPVITSVIVRTRIKEIFLM